MGMLEPRVVEALLSADTSEKALEVAAASPMLLSLNVELILWNGEQSALDFAERRVYRMLREILSKARGGVPISMLIQGEIACKQFTGGGIELPASLADNFAPIVDAQARGATAKPSERAAAIAALSLVLDRFEQSDAAAVRAVTLSMRGDLVRVGLSQTSLGDITRVCDDYKEAAELFRDGGFPLWRARILNKLGNHCQTHPMGAVATSLRQAIECHTEAMRLLSEPEVVAERGDILYNLGNDFTKLHQRIAVGREEAISLYREALTIRTRDRDRRAFAETNHGLGRSLSLPIKETCHGTNAPAFDALDEAIAAYETGIAALGSTDAPTLYSAMQHDLGVAYLERSCGEQGIEKLTKAIHAFRTALRFRSPSADATEYATTQNALGVAYFQLPFGSPNALREAERCFREALQYRSIEREPDYFSDTSDNLGMALLRGAKDEPGVRAALTCFAQALRARPRNSRLRGYVQSMTHAGHAYEALAKFGVPLANEAAEKHLNEVAGIIGSWGDGGDLTSIMEQLRSLPLADHVW